MMDNRSISCGYCLCHKTVWDYWISFECSSLFINAGLDFWHLSFALKAHYVLTAMHTPEATGDYERCFQIESKAKHRGGVNAYNVYGKVWIAAKTAPLQFHSSTCDKWLSCSGSQVTLELKKLYLEQNDVRLSCVCSCEKTKTKTWRITCLILKYVCHTRIHTGTHQTHRQLSMCC